MNAIGYAKSTARNQLWLNTCPAVRAWIDIGEGWIEFQFDSSVEVAIVPPGIYFEPDAMSQEDSDSLSTAKDLSELDYGNLRDCLAQIGADSEIVDWFVDTVDEWDAFRRSGYCNMTLAENLKRWYDDEREANADSKQHAAEQEEA